MFIILAYYDTTTTTTAVMIRGLCSGNGYLLFIAMLRPVLGHAEDAVLGALTPAKVSVSDVWATADTINVSFLPFNLSNHRILVSVQQENDTAKIMVDTLPSQPPETQDILAPIKHQVDELEPDTRYELCVVLSEQEHSQADALQSECYKVKTFPKVDNVKGIYAALASVGVFLVACGLAWLLYMTFWVKYFTKVFKVEDSQQMEQQVESQSSPSSNQEISETTVSTTTTIT